MPTAGGEADGLARPAKGLAPGHHQHAGRGAQPSRRQQRYENDCDYRQGVVAPEKSALHVLSIQAKLGGRLSA